LRVDDVVSGAKLVRLPLMRCSRRTAQAATGWADDGDCDEPDEDRLKPKKRIFSECSHNV
jgi:hypothetical protein